jgi:hypothetical protein
MKQLQQLEPSATATASAREDAALDNMIQDFQRLEIDNCAADKIAINNNIGYIKDNVDYGGEKCVETEADVGF